MIKSPNVGDIGYQLKPEQFSGTITKKTIGPKNGVGYDYLLEETTTEIDELWKTYENTLG